MKKILITMLTITSLLLLSGCADAGKDQVINEGDIVTLDGSASEAKYGWTILKYKWKQIKGKHVQLENSNTSIATFIAPGIGKKKRKRFIFLLTTVEESPWGMIKQFKDKVKITVQLSEQTDVVPPVITLNGNSNITVYVGDNYIEQGATATDNEDGNVSVTIKGSVDTSKEGNYTIVYEASDKAGNQATEERKIEVKELSNEEKIKKLENNNTIPRLNRDDTLAGEDNNSNGIRDDIDRYIDIHYTNGEEHAAVQQSVRVIQKALLVDKTNSKEIRIIDMEDSRAVNCLFQVFEPINIPSELESLVANTKNRLLEYLKFSKALDGTTSSMLKGDTCD